MGRLGFILAAIGSAVGLGNIWRFPYIVGQNGGGSFVLAYIIAIVIFGLPVILIEIGSGRKFRESVLEIFNRITRKYSWTAYIPILTEFMILGFYFVIAGWTLAYMVNYGLGHSLEFNNFNSSKMPIVYFSLSLIITSFIVSKGIKKGIEKFCTYTVPILFLILGIMLIKVLTLPNALEGVMFYMKPNAESFFNPKIWAFACSQALFSIGAGQGIMMTYGAYMKKDEDIFNTSKIIAIADTLVALLAAIIIFSVVFSFDKNPAEGPELAFITLPSIFNSMSHGYLFGFVFFVLLFFAALTSAVSMLEMVVSNFKEKFNMSRNKSTAILSSILFLIGSAVVFNIVSLEKMDYIFSGLMINLAAAIICLVIGWGWTPDFLMKEIENEEDLVESHRLKKILHYIQDFVKYTLILYLVRYVIPFILILLFVYQLISGTILA